MLFCSRWGIYQDLCQEMEMKYYNIEFILCIINKYKNNSFCTYKMCYIIVRTIYLIYCYFYSEYAFFIA